jgi:hypothetical protein
MKRAILACLVAATAVLPGFAHAKPAPVTGTITAGNPASAAVGGVTELADACLSDTAAEGVDGVWFAVAEDLIGADAVLTGDGGAANDFDVYWYDASCSLISNYTMANDPAPGENEQGVVPDAAAFGIVDLFSGANASFTLTIG